MSPTPARAGRRRTCLAGLLRDERGATAIEYGLLAALMAVVIMGGLAVLGGETGALYGVLETIRATIEAALEG